MLLVTGLKQLFTRGPGKLELSIEYVQAVACEGDPWPDFEPFIGHWR